MTLRGGTLFSGIGAPECAMPWVDWRWGAEIDPFASAVRAARFGTMNLGDVTEIDPDAVEPVDLVVFGSPCQSFSVAGKRAGLDDPRGNMALVGLRVVAGIRPRWVVFENVPGLLSSDEGRDFGAFLGLLGECGYGFAYRVLDAQYAGVPQRRRRVFVVGHLGDWRPAAAVLFEPESLSGYPAPRREAGKGIAASLSRGAERSEHSGYAGRRREDDENLAFAVNASRGKACSHDPTMETFVASAGNLADDACNPGSGGRTHSRQLLDPQMSVRRLTPRECERLQGFPDDWTMIPYRGKPAADGPRYRALGNSMAVPVVRWIGERIALFGQTRAEIEAA